MIDRGGVVFALASGAGRAALSVLRVSGDGTAAIVAALCGSLPPPRRASLRTLRDEAGTVLDRALVLWFPGPASYTGEDMAELQLHGGRAVLAAVTDRLVECGARPAEPGQFTRRACLNGRMNLIQAEGIADLIDAETSAQRRQALRQMEGGLAALIAGWADQLRRTLAYQEALIDFPDEDLPETVLAELVGEIAALQAALHAHLTDRRGERLRDGLVVAVIGPPNAGKSSLVNALADREVAIVSPVAGTTRDAVETRFDLGGLPVTLVDTAGLRETEDPIELEGIRRARARAADADLVLALHETPAAPPIAQGPTHLPIATKIDLTPAPPGWIGISASTGAGLDELRARMLACLQGVMPDSAPPLTRARHRAALQDAAAFLEDAETAALPELRGEALRQALQALGRITGQVGVEEILDTVFGSFCIGK